MSSRRIDMARELPIYEIDQLSAQVLSLALHYLVYGESMRRQILPEEILRQARVEKISILSDTNPEKKEDEGREVHGFVQVYFPLTSHRRGFGVRLRWERGGRHPVETDVSTGYG
ncbi:MAG: hypothetical protein ABSG74_13545 [Candidatus Bathyarchaeia archaeon]|jgi:hypothetical protein